MTKQHLCPGGWEAGRTEGCRHRVVLGVKAECGADNPAQQDVIINCQCVSKAKELTKIEEVQIYSSTDGKTFITKERRKTEA